MKKILILLATVIGIVAGAVLVNYAVDKREQFVQPIDFSHAVHAGKYKIPCMACHQRVMMGARASIPNIEVCGACHTTPMKKTPQELLVYQYVSQHKQIPWYSIYHVPDYVYFSHRRHVGLGKLDCKNCHGDMAALNSPPKTQFLQIKMQNCWDCHEKHNVTTDCSHCHR
jgi:Cytochrome c7 and related cytochrome c